MKKVLLFAVGVMMSFGAMAQNFTYGVKVGVDLTNHWGKNTDHGMKLGYQAGVFGEYKFDNSNFAIAPEIVFAAQGSKWSPDDTGDITFNCNYVNVPVMVKYYVTPDFSIDLGPQLGINVYAKNYMKDADVTVDMKDHVKNIDFGVGLGASYNLSANAFLQARYTLGLTKVYKDAENPKNANIQLSFGYRF